MQVLSSPSTWLPDYLPNHLLALISFVPFYYATVLIFTVIWLASQFVRMANRLRQPSHPSQDEPAGSYTLHCSGAGFSARVHSAFHQNLCYQAPRVNGHHMEGILDLCGW